jgi:hypothetical protein
MHPGSRRLSVFVSILAAASLAPGPSAAADEPLDPGGTELRLVWTDLCRVGPLTVEGITRELRTLLDPVGIRVLAESSEVGRSEQTRGMWLVLMPRNPRFRRGAPAAGSTLRAQTNAIWVFPPEVAMALGLDIRHLHGWDLRTRLRFHRALAVVVLHELAHALAGAEHGRQGLMVPSLGSREMLDPGLAVPVDLRPILLAGVARLGEAPAAPASP